MRVLLGLLLACSRTPSEPDAGVDSDTVADTDVDTAAPDTDWGTSDTGWVVDVRVGIHAILDGREYDRIEYDVATATECWRLDAETAGSGVTNVFEVAGTDYLETALAFAVCSPGSHGVAGAWNYRGVSSSCDEPSGWYGDLLFEGLGFHFFTLPDTEAERDACPLESVQLGDEIIARFACPYFREDPDSPYAWGDPTPVSVTGTLRCTLE